MGTHGPSGFMHTHLIESSPARQANYDQRSMNEFNNGAAQTYKSIEEIVMPP